MTDTGCDRAAVPHVAPPQEPAYEPPQLWQYGSLRVDTADGFTGAFMDDGVNIS